MYWFCSSWEQHDSILHHITKGNHMWGANFTKKYVVFPFYTEDGLGGNTNVWTTQNNGVGVVTNVIVCIPKVS
jgi:hypothetical protein